MAEKDEKKKKKLDAKVVWQEARGIIWERRKRLAVGLGLIFVSRVAGLILPASPKLLIDDIINAGVSPVLSAVAGTFGFDAETRFDLLLTLAAIVGVATLIQGVTSFALVVLVQVAAQRTITEMRKRVEQHVMRLPVSYFDSTKSGELISRIINDAEGIRNLVGTGLVQLVGGLLTAAVAFTVLLYLNWRLTLGVVAVLLFFVGMMAIAFKRLRPIFRERGEISARVTGRLGEALGGVRLVKAFTAEKREDLIFARGAHDLLRNVARSMTGVATVTTGATLVAGAVGVLMLIIGGRSIITGEMTVGDFVTYVMFTGMVAAPLVQISSISTQLSEAFAGLDRIREIRRLATEDEDGERRERLTALRGEVEFEDVWFEYVPDTPVLKRISFRAPEGSTTALVGPSGSGKSTLTGLVMAFNRPTRGRVLVDGVDLTTARLRDYRSVIGVVMQDNFLFDGTIVENIAYGRPDATRAQIEAAGRVAHCEEFVSGFEEGYDTVVGERGVKLSGGQRQRVAIARAIVADPKILILDEATSSLDSESESMIQDGLATLRSGRTTFVIAHRLSTIRSADQILVLDGGEIVEKGTHAELLARGGLYRQLYDKQYQLETDLFVNPGEDFTPEPEAVTSEPQPSRRGGGGIRDL